MACNNRMDRQAWHRGLQGALGLGLFITLWKGIETPLLYYGFGVFTAYPVFSFEGSFLRSSLGAAGGTVVALASLLSQSYSSAWLGALVLACVLAVLFAGVRRLLESVQAGPLRDLAWIPVVLALMILHQYENPLIVLVAVGISLWTAILYGAWEGRPLGQRTGLGVALFVAAFVVAGSAAFVSVAIVCLIEGLHRRQRAAAILHAVLCLAAAGFLAGLVFGLDLRDACLAGTPWASGAAGGLTSPPGLLLLASYVFVPVVLLVLLVGRRLVRGRPSTRIRNCLGFAARALGVAGMGLGCLTCWQGAIRNERTLNYYARGRDWDQVIALAHQMRGRHGFTRSGVFDIDRALAHRGRLADELCSYPQEDTQTLLLTYSDMAGRLQHAKTLDLYLDLGYPNAAEKNAYELLDNDGPSPFVYEALVRVHLAKGQIEAAQIAFKALTQYVGSGKLTRPWQAIMDDPAAIEDHPLVQAWRKVDRTSDYGVEGIAFEPTLRMLLRDRPDHRLALEYLMAYGLLRHDRAAVAGCLPWLRAIGYTALPRHVAEALLIRSMETRTPADAQGWTLDPSLLAEARDIAAIVKGKRGDHQAAFDALAPKYGDTYTFYSLFNVCGVR